MQLLDDKSEKAIALLTQLAFGDGAVVRDALANHGDESVEAIINYIRSNRDPKRAPGQGARTLEVG
jgi:hypothetical protein